jgi:lysophospholipase L1-like esterase
MFERGREKTLELARHYKALAGFMKVDFFDAGHAISTNGVDGIHFSAKNNADLGDALADKVAEIFARTAA